MARQEELRGMSDAAEAYIDEIRAEKRMLQEGNRTLSTIVGLRQEIDALEGRDLPALPLNGPLPQEAINDHIGALIAHRDALQKAQGITPGSPTTTPKARKNGKGKVHEVPP